MIVDLTSNELLASLPPREQQELRPHLKRVRLERGAVLHETGDTVEKAYFPEGGAISLVIELSTGEIIESALVGRDGVAGGFAAMNSQAALNKALVQIEGSAFVIAAERLRQVCSPGSVLAALVGLHHQFLYAQAQQSAACNVSHGLEARLCRWLLRANELCGPTFVLTQEALAAFLGVRRTSVSLTAQSLQTSGIIRYRRGIIEIVDLERLQRTSCECHAALRAQRMRLQFDGKKSSLPLGTAG